MRGKPESVELFNQGREALENGDYRTAIRIGRKLHSQKYTGSFELLGRTYAAQGNLKKAIKELERGVEVAPTVYLLWSYLAEYYSDAGRYEEALVAFAKTESAGDDSGWPLYNQAVVRWRMDEPQRGLDLLDHRQITNDDKLESQANGLRLRFLNELERHQEALDFVRTFDKPNDQINMVNTELAYAYFGLGDLEKARSILFSNPDGHPRTLWLIRELDAQPGLDSKYWSLLVEGTTTIDEGAEPERVGFFRTFRVKAASPQDAFEFTKRFRTSEHESFFMNRSKKIRVNAIGPDGIYEVQVAEQYFDLKDQSDQKRNRK